MNLDFIGTMTVEHTKYNFIGEQGGKVFIATGNERKPDDNVSYLGSSGKYRADDDNVLWLEWATLADLPKRPADGTIDDGTDNRVWLIEQKEWLAYAKKNIAYLREKALNRLER